MITPIIKKMISNDYPDTPSKYRCNHKKISVIQKLYRKTLAATAGTGCIGVMEVKTLAVKAVAEIKLRAGKIQERLHIEGQAYTLVFKKLVAFPLFVIKIKIIGQARTATPFHRNTQKPGVIQSRILHQVIYL
jgi:hypothetical protein